MVVIDADNHHADSASRRFGGGPRLRTQVGIIGGGPSGLLLALLLHRSGIDSVVLERQTRAHVLSRIRAGVLEWGTVETLRRAGVGGRLDAEGMPHDGTFLARRNEGFRIDFAAHGNCRVMVYGQTEVTRDLYAALDAAGVPVIHEVEGVAIHGADSDTPSLTFTADGTGQTLHCDFIAGCDGFHGVSRKTIPAMILHEYERIYPFGWLGILSETPPAAEELIYAQHSRGFALCSMRNANLSRYYIQVPSETRIEAWPDAAFWDELRRRIPEDTAETLVTGPSIEKSIAPLRSFVAEPMSWGRLFLVGDAAHIVPPTGAKGLNLAVSDVHYLHEGLVRHYAGDGEALAGYSDRALARAWKAVRFSWSLTQMTHHFPGLTQFEQRMQEAELDYLHHSRAAQAVFAENYTGLPY